MFSKLPPEIRQMIYIHVFESYVKNYQIKKPKFLIALKDTVLYEEAHKVFVEYYVFTITLKNAVDEGMEGWPYCRKNKKGLEKFGEEELKLVKRLCVVVS